MRWRLTFVVLCCALAFSLAQAPSRAQVWLWSNNGSVIGSSSGFICPQAYCGPGDIASGAIGFWSAGRSYNNAYAQAQSPLADIVDTATGLAGCTVDVGTNGFANLTATACPTGAPTVSVATFCTVTHAGCSIAKLYDQTGNGNDVTQAALANMPALALNAQNGLPCPAGTGSAATALQSSKQFSQNAPFTEAAVVNRTGSTSVFQSIFSDSALGRVDFQSAANVVRIDNGTSRTLTAADNAFHALIGVASSTSPLFAIDTSANISTLSNGTTALSSASPYYLTYMGNGAGAQALLSGYVCEMSLWPSGQNSNYINLLANMRSSTNGWNF